MEERYFQFYDCATDYEFQVRATNYKEAYAVAYRHAEDPDWVDTLNEYEAIKTGLDYYTE